MAVYSNAYTGLTVCSLKKNDDPGFLEKWSGELWHGNREWHRFCLLTHHSHQLFFFFSPFVFTSVVSHPAGTQQAKSATNEEKSQGGGSKRSHYDFSSAKKRQHSAIVAGKTARRGAELMDIIRLEASSADLFEMAPSDYEAYIRRFGRSNAKQVRIVFDRLKS